MNGYRSCGIYVYIYLYIYIQWHITQAWKDLNFAICNNLDGLGWCYVQWNKSDRKINTVCYHSFAESKKYNETSEYNNKEIDLHI